jgi:phosphoribosylanthranilate isomerase
MWVKICGWNDPAVLQESLAISSPDAIGLNFFAKSVRAVTIPIARELRGCLPRNLAAVGVFVNHSREEIIETVQQVGLDLVQLHGDESPEFAASLVPLSIIRVYRLKEPTLSSIESDLTALRALGVRPWACLVDAWHEHEYGGTGQSAPWSVLQHWPTDWPPLILAGGLTAANVAAAIDTVRPFGVDTASGVESARGRKDPDLVRGFVEACRACP